MNFRQTGILIHPTAFSGPYGIGDIGFPAYEFVDNLVDMGQNLWQILPIGPTDMHNSPYSSISTFAGNHMLISLDLLIKDGLLDSKLIKNSIPNLGLVNFKKANNFKMSILNRVCDEFHSIASEKNKQAFKTFCVDNSYWLDEFSEFWALKEENNNKPWIDWKTYKVEDHQLIFKAMLLQYFFHQQWSRLRQYCRKRKIKIIGDMPIYVGYNSADVYFNRQLFELNTSGHMICQSGSPPCNFQRKGQLWGMPVYNWDSHLNSNFSWWKLRFKKLFEMVDIIRLDHFIGYVNYYKIPIKYKTAKFGKWVKAPGAKLFKELILTFPDFNVIVEDLGEITNDVIQLRKKFDFIGTKVLQFELCNILLKEDMPLNSILYTGTHDNNTIIGWFKSLPKNSINKTKLTRETLLNYFKSKEENIHWNIIDYAFASSSSMLIIPMQDILGKDSIARFNEPGTISSLNWSWRMKNKELTKAIKEKILELSIKHKRIR